MNRFSAGCACCGCSWNGCTKPNSFSVSGSTAVGSPYFWNNIDGTYSPITYVPLSNFCIDVDNYLQGSLGVDGIWWDFRTRWQTAGGGNFDYDILLTITYGIWSPGVGYVDKDEHDYQWSSLSASSCPSSGTKTLTFQATTVTGAGAGSTAPTSCTANIP